MKNEKTKKFVINHLIPILFFLFLSLFIFRNIIGLDGVIIDGDFIYSPDLGKFFKYFYPMWDDNLSLGALSRLPRLLFYLPFIQIGFLFNLKTTDVIIIGFIFCEFLAGISMYYASRYLLSKTYKKRVNKNRYELLIKCPNCKNIISISDNSGENIFITCPQCDTKGFYDLSKKIHEKRPANDNRLIEVEKSVQNRINSAALVAGIAYMWSNFLLQNFLFPQHRFAYALTPFIILTLIIGIEKDKLHYIILTGFLWCIACADMHWTVHGAILLFCFLFYNFVLSLVEVLPHGFFNAFKTSFLTHLKYMIVLVGSFISFSFYWFLPGFLMGGTSRYPATIYAEINELFYSQNTMIHLMSDQHSTLSFYFTALFNSSPNFLNSSWMQNVLLLLGLVVFIFGMLALLLKPKNRYILFFSIFTFLILFIASIPMFSQGLYFWFATKAPLSNLYGWVFKRPMILQFLMLSISFLIGFSLVEVISKVEKSNINNIKLRFKRKIHSKVKRNHEYYSIINIHSKKWVIIGIFLILLLCILLPKWPLASGDHSGVITPVPIPDEFDQVNNWLETKEGDFKVLWLPKYWGNNIDWYPNNRINKDIAGLVSTKPTYVFWGPAKQPNGYGIHFFSSNIITLNDDALLLNNGTKNFGKYIAPLGIKYILFHDDNATSWDINSYTDADDIFTLLKNQDDLKIIEEFGFISIFENTYYEDYKKSLFFTTSDDFLLFGGLGPLATLNSIPSFHSRDNGLIFGNQKLFEKDTLNDMIDGFIFTQSAGIEEVVFSYIDKKYFVIPFDFAESRKGYEEWTKIRINNFINAFFNRNGNFGEWEKDYGDGIVYTWSSGTIKNQNSLHKAELILHNDFELEKDINSFTSYLTSNLNLSLSNNSISGNNCLMGMIKKADQHKIQYVQSQLFPLNNSIFKHRISFYIAAEDINNAQVRISYFDIEKKLIKSQFLFTKSGTFSYKNIEHDMLQPIDTRYYSIQIISNQNPIANSTWWIDDIRLYNLNNITSYTTLNMTFNVEKTDTYNLFIRCLKSEGGGKINVFLDDNQLNSIITFDPLNSFNWIQLNSSYLTEGSHTLTIENVGGFNAINLIAAVPAQKMEQYFESAYDFIKDKKLIYILEAESDFYFKNGTISNTYGNLVSSARVIELNDNGQAWLPLEILQQGNYSLCIKSAGGSPQYNLIPSIDDFSYEIYSDKNKFIWHNFTNISLSPDVYDLRFAVSQPVSISNLSFERGWNETNNAPINWSSPHPHYSLSLDSLSKTQGEYSLKITTNSSELFNYSRVINEELTLESNNDYEVKIDIKTSNVNDTHVKIIGYNETLEDWELVTNIVQNLVGSTDWNEYTAQFYITNNITKIRVILNVGGVLNSADGNATSWFDNIRLFNITGKKNNEIDLVIVYLNDIKKSIDNTFSTIQENPIIEYKKIDATKYEVTVSTEESFTLVFSEAYDEFWIANIEGVESIKSIPIYSMLNGFFINKTGNYTVIIEYLPQQWFSIGATITSFSIIGFFGYIMWEKRNIFRLKFKNLIKMIELYKKQ